MPAFFLVPLGGLFYFGFRIYVHELSVIVTIIPLVGAIILKKGSQVAKRSAYDTVAFLLLLYLCAHLIGCLVYNKANNLGGLGNVVRRYADAIWPLLLVFPIVLYADFRQVKLALRLVLVATLSRWTIGAFGVLSGRDDILFIPILNYMPANGGAFADLRVTGAALAAIAIVWLVIARGCLARLIYLGLIGLGIVSTLFGSGRIALLSAALMIAFSCVVFRKWSLLGLGGGAGLVLVILINVSPDGLWELHPTVRRSASGFILDSSISEQIGETGLSNQWHDRLIGEAQKVWLESAPSILFGSGVLPFVESAWSKEATGALYFDSMVGMARDTKRFESGLWSTLATFGVVGTALFVLCLVRILSLLLPHVMTGRIESATDGLAFLATFQCIVWLLLCWVSGDYPSYPIFLGLVAVAALKQQNDEHKKASLMPDLDPIPALNGSRPTAPVPVG